MNGLEGERITELENEIDEHDSVLIIRPGGSIKAVLVPKEDEMLPGAIVAMAIAHCCDDTEMISYMVKRFFAAQDEDADVTISFHSGVTH